MRRPIIKTATGNRYLFFGTFKGYGITGGTRGIGQRIEFINVIDSYGNPITDSVWFSDIKTFLKLNLVEGDIVSFYARATAFEDLYPNYRYGYPFLPYYRLLNPTKAEKLFCPVKSTKYKDTKCKIHINIR